MCVCVCMCVCVRARARKHSTIYRGAFFAKNVSYIFFPQYRVEAPQYCGASTLYCGALWYIFGKKKLHIVECFRFFLAINISYMLQHSATLCNTLQYTATHCHTLQHTATHCNTLQHTATHCNTLQHTATYALNKEHCKQYRRSQQQCRRQRQAQAGTHCSRTRLACVVPMRLLLYIHIVCITLRKFKLEQEVLLCNHTFIDAPKDWLAPLAAQLGMRSCSLRSLVSRRHCLQTVPFWDRLQTECVHTYVIGMCTYVCVSVCFFESVLNLNMYIRMCKRVFFGECEYACVCVHVLVLNARDHVYMCMYVYVWIHLRVGVCVRFR